MIENLYISTKSPVHDLNFWTKFLVLLLFLPLASFMSPLKLIPLLVLMLFMLIGFSHVGIGRFWKMSKIYIVSLSIGVLALSLFFTQGDLVNRLFLGFVLALRFILLISFGMLFAASTNPIEIPTGFLQAKLPHKYGIILMVGLRMMPLLSAKIQTVIDAQKARGASFRFSVKRLPRLAQQAAALLVPILHFTLETSVQLSDTLISRGYNPDGKITKPPVRFGMGDYVLLLGSIIFFLLTFLQVYP